MELLIIEQVYDNVFGQDPCNNCVRPQVGSVMAYHWNKPGKAWFAAGDGCKPCMSQMCRVMYLNLITLCNYNSTKTPESLKLEFTCLKAI